MEPLWKRLVFAIVICGSIVHTQTEFWIGTNQDGIVNAADIYTEEALFSQLPLNDSSAIIDSASRAEKTCSRCYAEKGNRGPEGPIGNTGPKGDKGDRGEHGYMGNPGQKGDVGFPGRKGDQGPAGAPGIDGHDGKDGMPGMPGLDGLNGLKGMRGNPGSPGITGEKGVKGEHGLLVFLITGPVTIYTDSLDLLHEAANNTVKSSN